MSEMLEINAITGTRSERDFTDDERSNYETVIAESKMAQETMAEQIAAQEAAKQSARTKLAALGLTDDEINALIP